MHLALAHDSRIVFERFVTGQEVECAVMGNDGPQGTLPGEILASQEFYTYDDKYIAGTSRVVIPAQLSPEKLEEVRATAVRAYRTLCCTGLARVDFFVEAGTGQGAAQRDQHHARLHRHQHVSQADDARGHELRRSAGPADPARL